ncbi:Uncharacterised protein [Candidatus Bartonella washoeensis]|uniref:Uncharacterized protein n=1 Tax=Candidatus Bartonella washoeensis Sb944nv TaxID=1094563 RepID=J0Q9C1_9HYPH|nr:hypothetical protein MCQ_00830 [Bartonella washoeensis Sb944nv]SPU26614.1 Uncharacterised protein [Bartonella washoeensis]
MLIIFNKAMLYEVSERYTVRGSLVFLLSMLQIQAKIRKVYGFLILQLSFILVKSKLKAVLAYLYKHLIICVKGYDSHNAQHSNWSNIVGKESSYRYYK